MHSCTSPPQHITTTTKICIFQHTHFELFSEDGSLAEGRTVPAAVPELKLALIDAHLHSFSYDYNGIRATLADDPLSRCESWDFVADDARSQRYHWWEPSTADLTETQNVNLLSDYTGPRADRDIHRMDKSIDLSLTSCAYCRLSEWTVPAWTFPYGHQQVTFKITSAQLQEH